MCVSNVTRMAASFAQQPLLVLVQAVAFALSSQQSAFAFVELLPSPANNAGASANTAIVMDRSDFMTVWITQKRHRDNGEIKERSIEPERFSLPRKQTKSFRLNGTQVQKNHELLTSRGHGR